VGKVIDRVRTRADRRLEVVREERRLQAMEREIEFIDRLAALPTSDKQVYVLIEPPPKPRKWWELWK
jgi:hypothetical protein